jgi:hypothetical protein
MVGTLFTPIGEWSKLHDRLYRCVRVCLSVCVCVCVC